MKSYDFKQFVSPLASVVSVQPFSEPITAMAVVRDILFVATGNKLYAIVPVKKKGRMGK